MTPDQQIEIAFMVEPVPVNTRVTIELRPGTGAALPFSKTTPATITNTNVLS
jgi:archaellin